jgi:hypothetical protein
VKSLFKCPLFDLADVLIDLGINLTELVRRIRELLI